jgi:hypothetical protein
MSDRAESHTPTLIRPKSVHGWSANPKDLFLHNL